MDDMGARFSSDESNSTSDDGDIADFLEVVRTRSNEVEGLQERGYQLQINDLSRLSFLRQLGFLPMRPDASVESDKNIPSPVPMDKSYDIYRQVMMDSGQSSHIGCPRNISAHIEKRQLYRDSPSAAQKVALTSEMLPSHHCMADSLDSRVFCGTYSKDGSIFLSSTQDSWIRLYDTQGSNFKCFKALQARDVGWSILDTVLSPDQQWLAYSTWSPYINIASVHSDKHFSLDLLPIMGGSFCAFSVKFSNDGNEIFASSNDEHVYVYDRTRCERVLAIHAHSDDVSALNVEGESSHMIYSGGDDGLCKVWDRRILSEVSPQPVGVLAGHKDGITYIDPKGDCRHLITNSKDQTIKLWDLRKFSRGDAVEATLDRVSRQSWDYRWEDVPVNTQKDARTQLPGDTSIMTYAGHLVKNTLLRCRFSPQATTGQRYIYTACAKGRVIIYDVLTGEVVKRLESDKSQGVVRDVSWHPTSPGKLVASSWDGYLTLWSLNQTPHYAQCRRPRRQYHW
ncbi:DDB1- and CUL4-associated factor 11-like isoform X2 [Halichondria panicea]|uniref:DDB1- and CUL4-associated factor 11-like isoform X2 n=1 Tax=Halichondria panicea TaxID=6063 RepID=UPI00312B9AC1